MSTLNKVTLIGIVGAKPKIIDKGNYKYAILPIGTKSYYMKGQEKVEKTIWHKIILKNGPANYAENYINIGDSVCVEGRIDNFLISVKDVKINTTQIISSNFFLIRKNTKIERSDLIPGETKEEINFTLESDIQVNIVEEGIEYPV